jgi:hypothetical protein
MGVKIREEQRWFKIRSLSEYVKKPAQGPPRVRTQWEHGLHGRGGMGKRHALVLAILLFLMLLGWFVAQRALDPERRGVQVEGEDARTGVVGGPAAPHGPAEVPDDAEVRGDVVYTPRDVEIFHEVMERAEAERMDTLPMGEIIVRIARPFVGEPYTPQTLELPGPERVVVNLREFDCVTYVESVLAMARLVRDGRHGFAAFTEELRRIRYRDGQLNGYPSRLHYFSEWIADKERLGMVRDITRELSGARVTEPVDFMSRNASAYPKLVDDPGMVDEIRQVEERLSGLDRYAIPQEQIARVADRIRNGDVIALTSTVRGLDIAHTGFALWVDGRLHLMHAPLVGRSLEISERPLAQRILGISGQDGMMVARPL